MKFFRTSFTAVMVGAAFVAGQVVVEEEVQLDTVDLFSQEEHPPSAAIAMGASALLPGLGQQYLGNINKALGFLCADAAMICGLIYFNVEATRLQDDAKAYAWQYAGAQGGPGANETYWEHVGAFMDSDEFNRILELNRDEEAESRKYLADNLQWRWTSDSLRNVYRSIREKASRLRTASSFVVAGLLLNRLISFVDARITAGRRNTTRSGRLKLSVVASASAVVLQAEL